MTGGRQGSPRGSARAGWRGRRQCRAPARRGASSAARGSPSAARTASGVRGPRAGRWGGRTWLAADRVRGPSRPVLRGVGVRRPRRRPERRFPAEPDPSARGPAGREQLCPGLGVSRRRVSDPAWRRLSEETRGRRRLTLPLCPGSGSLNPPPRVKPAEGGRGGAPGRTCCRGWASRERGERLPSLGSSAGLLGLPPPALMRGPVRRGLPEMLSPAPPCLAGSAARSRSSACTYGGDGPTDGLDANRLCSCREHITSARARNPCLMAERLRPRSWPYMGGAGSLCSPGCPQRLPSLHPGKRDC